MKIANFESKIEIPEGLDVKIDNGTVVVSKDGKSLTRNLRNKKVSLKIEGNSVVVAFKKGTKIQKMVAGTFQAHIKNMFKGLLEGHIYKLKICSGHFPMSINNSENKFIVNNFLGEKTPRELNLRKGANVKVEGDIIFVEGFDKELVSQTALDIEKLTKIKGRDLRIFQDGIYIINKDGMEIV